MDVCCKLGAPSLTNNKADVICSNLIGFTNTMFPTMYLSLSNVVDKELNMQQTNCKINVYIIQEMHVKTF